MIKAIKYYLSLIAITIFIVCCFITYPIITSIIVGIVLYHVFMLFAAMYALSDYKETDVEWAKDYAEELNKEENDKKED